MILIQLYHLENETSEELRKNRERVWRREISEQEGEERFEAIMQRYRMETERILSHQKNPYDTSGSNS